MERKTLFFFTLAWTLGIAVACLVSMNKVPHVSVLGKDKVIHSFFYFVFSVLWFLFLSKGKQTWNFRKKAVVVIVAAFLYGTALEICQELFTVSRTADVSDVAANIVGSLAGIVLLSLVDNLRKDKRA